MKDWDEIRQWRKATRAELLAQRLAIPRTEKLFRRPIIGGLISGHFTELRHACIGFYWPFKGEIDLRHLVRDFIAQGAEAALPVVVEKGQPVEFWSWRPRMKLGRGIWDIRSEEHTSELQSLMRISYAAFCLKKKKYECTTKPITDKMLA